MKRNELKAVLDALTQAHNCVMFAGQQDTLAQVDKAIEIVDNAIIDSDADATHARDTEA